MKYEEDIPFLFGGDYNPEQWPEDSWQADIDKLKQAEINSATINVFSWALLEPSEGKYEFDMLDKIIKLLAKNNMSIVLATSTGAIPAWISKKYPEVSRVDKNSIRQIQGKRHNACPNSKVFRRLSANLVESIAKRYAKKFKITVWHISNEYEGYCYCDQCKKEFRTWLIKKYKNLTSLNQNWNSNFWSHTFNDWNEIEPPMLTTDLFSNGKSVLSGAEIDYRRFQSQSLLNNYIVERDIIKKIDDKAKITTNFMGSQKDLDYFKWAPEIDVISWDNYPQADADACEAAMDHDLMRGLKKQPFMLMEQTPNQQNWYSYNKLKQPNEMRMLSYQAIAHGASSIQFFQLKQSRSGAEKFHGAVLTMGDSTTTRTYQEIKKLGNELKNLPNDIKNANFEAEVAIIFDWESYWGIENSIGPIADLSYVKEVQRFYKAFYDAGISVDMISKDSDVTKYKIVVAPVLYMWNDNFSKHIAEYVERGGVFATTYMSGIVDESDNIFVGGYLEPLKEVLGIKVDERDARTDDEAIEIIENDQVIGKAAGVCDLVIVQKAKSLSHYSDQVFYSKNSVITVNNFGNGKAFYCGAALDNQGMQNLVERLCDAGKVVTSGQKNVEITKRRTKDSIYFFVINTSNEAIAFENPEEGSIDLLSGKKTGEILNLESFGVVILEKKIKE